MVFLYDLRHLISPPARNGEILSVQRNKLSCSRPIAYQSVIVYKQCDP